MLLKRLFLVFVLILPQVVYARIYFCEYLGGVISISIQDEIDIFDAITVGNDKLLFNTRIDFQYLSANYHPLPANETLAINLLRTLLGCNDENQLVLYSFEEYSIAKDRFFYWLIDVSTNVFSVSESYLQGEEVALPRLDAFITDAFKIFRDVYRSSCQDQCTTENIAEIDRRAAREWCSPEFKDHDLYIKMSWEKFKINNPGMLRTIKKKTAPRKRKNTQPEFIYQHLPMKVLRRKLGYFDYCTESYSYIK